VHKVGCWRTLTWPSPIITTFPFFRTLSTVVAYITFGSLGVSCVYGRAPVAAAPLPRNIRCRGGVARMADAMHPDGRWAILMNADILLFLLRPDLSNETRFCSPCEQLASQWCCNVVAGVRGCTEVTLYRVQKLIDYYGAQCCDSRSMATAIAAGLTQIPR
jgi:hypothetical protein